MTPENHCAVLEHLPRSLAGLLTLEEILHKEGLREVVVLAMVDLIRGLWQQLLTLSTPLSAPWTSMMLLPLLMIWPIDDLRDVVEHCFELVKAAKPRETSNEKQF